MGLIMFGALIGLILINIPVGVSIGLSAMIGIVFSDIPMQPVVIAQRMFTAVDSFPFMAIPFFMLAGGIMGKGGISKRLIHLASALIGGLRGGLGLITILASAFFGAISGSNPATVAAIGGIMVPAMISKGYPAPFSASVAAAGGTLGVVIPPSIPMITFGVVAGVSIGDMFIAGIGPGILLALLLSFVVVVQAKKLGIPLEDRTSLKDILMALRESILAIIMPLIILGGIYGGIFTPTEAGAVAVVYSLIVSSFIFKELDLKDLREVLIKAGISSAVVFFVIATSQSFSWLITAARISEKITTGMLSLSQNPFIIITLTNLLLLFLGVFLETQAIILLVAPILLPLLTGLGMDPILVGTMMVVNTSVGMITPPMAVNLFVASGLVKEYGVTMEKIALRIVPFLLAELVGILMVSNIPAISLGLLRLLKGG
ncbi:MAG: C4-dicarboxylate ABC transporter permease [spirochete symbiont of Stewartia floridana]|nr:MAG: C4-dicarboxylate ABC transporter permease [spirochete symbiont of Stewartia floridana]